MSSVWWGGRQFKRVNVIKCGYGHDREVQMSASEEHPQNSMLNGVLFHPEHPAHTQGLEGYCIMRNSQRAGIIRDATRESGPDVQPRVPNTIKD